MQTIEKDKENRAVSVKRVNMATLNTRWQRETVVNTKTVPVACSLRYNYLRKRSVI